MVGILSRLSSGRHNLRRSQSSIYIQQYVFKPQEVGVSSSSQKNAEAGSSIHDASAQGIGVEMMMVEHPTEPVNDQAIGCPLPEPSILNDGTLWKERMSNVSAAVRVDLPVMKKDGSHLRSKRKSLPAKEKRLMLPSVSAPEHAFLTMLEECNVVKEQSSGN